MATTTPDQITIYGTIASVLLLAIIVYFTRETRRKIAGARVGGLATDLIVFLIDAIASSPVYGIILVLQLVTVLWDTTFPMLYFMGQE